MENLQTSKTNGHYGLISELNGNEIREYRASLFMVMGFDSTSKTYEAMIFDYMSGRFCWAWPSEPGAEGEFGELYDKQTAMKLISHHALNGDGCQLKLFPVHIPFQGVKPVNYQNPYVFDGDSTELVEKQIKDSLGDEYEDEPYYLPDSLGGKFVGHGLLSADVEAALQDRTPVDVSDLEFIKPEEVA